MNTQEFNKWLHMPETSAQDTIDELIDMVRGLLHEKEVVNVSPKVTYTFPRACMLMIYGGAKIKLSIWGNTYVYYDAAKKLIRTKDGSAVTFDSYDVLGSWEVVL